MCYLLFIIRVMRLTQNNKFVLLLILFLFWEHMTGSSKRSQVSSPPSQTHPHLYMHSHKPLERAHTNIQTHSTHTHISYFSVFDVVEHVPQTSLLTVQLLCASIYHLHSLGIKYDLLGSHFFCWDSSRKYCTDNAELVRPLQRPWWRHQAASVLCTCS